MPSSENSLTGQLFTLPTRDWSCLKENVAIIKEKTEVTAARFFMGISRERGVVTT